MINNSISHIASSEAASKGKKAASTRMRAATPFSFAGVAGPIGAPSCPSGLRRRHMTKPVIDNVTSIRAVTTPISWLCDTPAADGCEVSFARRQYQRRAAFPRRRAERIPTLATETHRLLIEPNQAVDTLSISLTRNLEAGVWFAAVNVGHKSELGHDLTAEVPHPLSPVQAVPLGF